MAYMNQDKKRRIAAILKNIVPPDWKYSLAVRDHAEIIMTIRAAPVDFIRLKAGKQRLEDRSCGYFEIRERSIDDFPKEVSVILRGVFAALNLDNYDRSDVQTDYFDVGHYVTLRVGEWDKPFRHLAA